MKCQLTLYVTDNSPACTRAIQNAKKLCAEHALGEGALRIINVLENSRAARRDKIVVVPTLVKRSAFLAQKMVGDLSDRAALLTFFNKLNFLSSLRFSTFRFKKD
ncbi:MAG TPA: circadian clock KaiB family protein, partial [Coxiellaceae bacterium]|nr:circadian clock KaiB family protein [Coxiellaceae bacterium]